jgi:hypothetical protein
MPYQYNEHGDLTAWIPVAEWDGGEYKVEVVDSGDFHPKPSVVYEFGEGNTVAWYGGREKVSILDLFTEREWMEIEFCRVYAEEYDHGTDGHLIRKLVAKLADLLEEYCPDEDVEET